MKMLPRRKAAQFYTPLKKTYKMKAWTSGASRIPPRCQQPRADPGCSHLYPAASSCSSGTKRWSKTHREGWNWGGEQQMDPMPSMCPNATALTQGICLGCDRKAGLQLFYGQLHKITIMLLQCVFPPWYDILKPKQSSRSSFNFNVFYRSNQNNFFFNYL